MNLVSVTVDGSVGVVTMKRPDKRNALNTELVADVTRAFREIAKNESVRVVVLRGEGPAFCAGADLEHLQKIRDNGADENLADSMALVHMFESITNCPKPVIAMVHGAAIAGGCGLATVCDIVIAARQGAKFGYSEVKIGFIPAIVMVYLLRKVGDTQARRLVFTAETISADEALAIGMVSYVVDDGSFEDETMALARRVAENSSTAMALSKEMFNALPGMQGATGLNYAASMNAIARQTEDCKQGIDRFLSTQRK